MSKCLSCGGTGRHPGLVEAEPGSGRKLVSATAECRNCVKGLRLLVKRLEAYCAGVHAEPPEYTSGRTFTEAIHLIAAAELKRQTNNGGAR